MNLDAAVAMSLRSMVRCSSRNQAPAKVGPDARVSEHGGDEGFADLIDFALQLLVLERALGNIGNVVAHGLLDFVAIHCAFKKAGKGRERQG